MYVVTKNFRAKLTWIIIGIFCALLIICGRLFYLQIHRMHTFFARSQKNFQRTEKINSPRGNIVDRNGVMLVTNRPVAHVYWQGAGKRSFDETDTQILTALEAIIHKPLLTDPEFFEELKYAERSHKKICLSTDLSFEQLSKLEEQFSTVQQLVIDTQFERFYPYKSLASHMLGYLSHINLDYTGQMGLEKLLDPTLKGQPGTLLKTITSSGRNIAQVEIQKALAGQNIQTTLDVTLQKVAEAVFPEGNSGSLILMDPEDGSLVALVSKPDFDPSMFLGPITQETWQELQENHCFLNRAFHAAYPPGSIFKLVTVSAAIEQNIISPDAHIMCGGYSNYCGRQYYCSNRIGHGNLSLSEAVAHSCNILFFEIGKRIDVDLLASYANAFGLGHKTNSIFSEKTGLVPTRQWKRKTLDERWWQGETLSVAIGQSFLLVTPIQAARMIGSIFTGYLVTPRILMNEEIVKEPISVRPETLAFLRKTMRLAVTDGTGQKVNSVKNIIIHGKTSTAQVCQYEKHTMGHAYMEHAWFVAHIKYKHHKPLILVIVLENVGTSREATAVAKKFLVEYKKAVDGVV
ncbi:MAG TPA: penicillin-binding protein 2 [Candidatus Limnocylindria bacterium]|nr:penicillin-binding protein 2 [Candidatus Limnocylindria bacterium]